MASSVKYLIDWLTVSYAYDTDFRQYLTQPAFAVQDDKIKPLPAYNRCAKLACGRVDWHSDKPEQKRLLTFSGRDINNIRAAGIKEIEFLASILRLPQASITRLDFSVDIVNGQTETRDVKTLLEYGYVKTSARGSTDIEEKNLLTGEKGGMTLYIGSRSSTLMLRVYDKGAKEREKFNWLRVELEAKKERAMIIARKMVDAGSVMGPGCAAIRNFAMIDNPEISEALAGEMQIDLSIGRKITEWEKWCLEVALPAVMRAFDEELPGVVEWVSSKAWDKVLSDVLKDK